MSLQIEVVGPERVIRPEPGFDCTYRQCGSIAELREYMRPALQDRQPFGSDFEGSGLNTHVAQIAGWSFSTSPKTGLYVPVGHVIEPEANLPLVEVLKVAQEADAAGATSLWYSVAYDHELSEQRLHWVPQHWIDVIFEVFLVDSNVLQLGLKETSNRLLGRKMQELTELDEEWVKLSKKQQKLNPPKMPHQLPPARVTPYACADADHTRQIHFHPKVVAAAREQPQILRLESLLSPVMREGNRHGVYLDPVRLAQLEQETRAKIAELEPQIWAHFGEQFALTRKQYLATKVKALLGEDMVETTKGGAPTVSVKVLKKYKKRHPVVPLLIMYAQLVAALENYLLKLQRAHAHFVEQPWSQGRVRFAFGHIGVPTGRMKCGGGGKGKEAFLKGVADVNAQSIPDHEKETYLPNTRSAFCAPPNFVVVAVDYSQIELRLPANLAREPKWIEAFLSGKDIHTTNAQTIANINEPGIVVQNDDKKRRGGAKTTSFALLYGGDEFTVARNADVPVAEAKPIVEAFYHGHPALTRWMDGRKAHARAHGQIGTFLGRMRRLAQYFPPEPSRRDFKVWKAWRKIVSRGEREAVNHPVQGGAADIFKTACILIAKAIRDRGWDSTILSPQVLWIHDEVVFYVHREWVTRVVPVIVQAMEFPIRIGQDPWPVPLKAEPEVGSRHLYYQKQLVKAQKEGLDDHAAVWAQALATLSADETGTNSTWGELVPYEDWVRVYGDGARRAAARGAAAGGATQHPDHAAA